MFGWFDKEEKSTLSREWIDLNDLKQLDEIERNSHDRDVVVLKHSTRCSISSMALHRLESGGLLANPQTDFYYLDLIQYRDISNALSERTRIRHESPQILVFRNGKVIYHNSHGGIRNEELIEILKGRAV
ncbi:MAG: bacillithiol system redox-active protein YtxJ [Flavobacteriales bacterium]|nr:bacillithiol system redox-active protein YtxJ [Flavobacteriales bacterium]